MGADNIPYLFMLLGTVFAGLAWHASQNPTQSGKIAAKIRWRLAAAFWLMALLVLYFKH